MSAGVRFVSIVFAFGLIASKVHAAPCAAYPNNLSNGNLADATQVMANFESIRSCANSYLAPLASPGFTGSVGIDTAPNSVFPLLISTSASQFFVDVSTYQNAAAFVYRGENDSTGSAAETLIQLNNNAANGYLHLFGSGYASSGPYTANGVALEASGAGGLTLYAANASGTLKFFAGGSGTEAMHVSANSSVGIGTTTPAYPFDVAGDIRTSTCLRYSGGTLGTCTSDIRVKRDIMRFTLGLDAVARLQPVHFYYNGLGGNPDDGIEQLGLIAQGVEDVAPELVGTRLGKLRPSDTRLTPIKTVNYGALTYMLINSVKELKARNDGLKTAVADQALQIALLKTHLSGDDRLLASLTAALKAQAATTGELHAAIIELRRNSRTRTASR